MGKLKRKSYFLVGVDVVEIYATKGLSVVLELLKEGKLSKHDMRECELGRTCSRGT